MLDYFIDFTIVMVLIIAITAVMGVLTNGIGERLFGGKKKTVVADKSISIQTGWKNVGGKNNN
ncbi:hypothetical protein ACWE42_19710 [Sutcliffiella cohnii]|uniref:Uncharacterized protein n=1 Tax=Sutcliffiella cohnii TaxID=33932 RepID=A0A223KM84_9BACI|nr:MULTISPECIES: hypothetical protein [Sutcliffiella]AST90605.1 hypothetical protein BC6307_04580 [Sutcliffiella cohnii]MED4016894.1 hypothetical protein [Sutcliffiella cohnii]WBL16258.1 hypothetical protein O1A01_06405 [Sutcliffiella sp. NC1]